MLSPLPGGVPRCGSRPKLGPAVLAWPTYTRHIKLTPSSPALMISCDAACPAVLFSPGSAGATTTPLTTPACPLCSPTRVPLRTSHVLSVRSAEPLVTRWTLGAGWGASEVMGSCCQLGSNVSS